MDIKEYIADFVDSLPITLNYKQKNFLLKIFIDGYANGNKLAHDVINKAIFESQALPFIEDVVNKVEDEKSLELLTFGELSNIVDVNKISYNLIDRFFSKNANYISTQELEVYGLGSDADTILEKALFLTNLGVKDTLEDWIRKAIMKVADTKLSKVTQISLKTPTKQPLV